MCKNLYEYFKGVKIILHILLLFLALNVTLTGYIINLLKNFHYHTKINL